MVEPATRPTDVDPMKFIEALGHARKIEEARALDAMFRRVTGCAPRMWGPSIIGYGEYQTVYASGRNVTWMRSGFSPRKARHSLYLMGGYCDEGTGRKSSGLLGKLGKHSRGASCLYVNKLDDVDLEVLEELIRVDWEGMNRRYPD